MKFFFTIVISLFCFTSFSQEVIKTKEINTIEKNFKRLGVLDDFGFYTIKLDHLTKNFTAEFVMDIFDKDLEIKHSVKFNSSSDAIFQKPICNGNYFLFSISENDYKNTKYILMDSTGKVVNQMVFSKHSPNWNNIAGISVFTDKNSDFFFIKKLKQAEGYLLERYDKNFQLLFSRKLTGLKIFFEILEVKIANNNIYCLTNDWNKNSERTLNLAKTVSCYNANDGTQNFAYNLPRDTAVFQPSYLSVNDMGESIVSGVYYGQKSKHGASGLFLVKLNKYGTKIQEKTYSWESLNWIKSNPLESDKYKNIYIRNLKEENEHITILAEAFTIKGQKGLNTIMNVAGLIGPLFIYHSDVTFSIKDLLIIDIKNDEMPIVNTIQKEGKQWLTKSPVYISEVCSPYSLEYSFDYLTTVEGAHNKGYYLMKHYQDYNNSITFIDKNSYKETNIELKDYSNHRGAFKIENTIITYEFKDAITLKLIKYSL